ncbi:MAG: YihY/virulence factor BrkB family protein [Gorillibacterium sp.]|nr:YihY/virulence factor BrkB family protein [Gorillibacterium sp.]
MSCCIYYRVVEVRCYPDVRREHMPRGVVKASRAAIVKGFVRVLYSRYKQDDVPARSAQLTYYLILSSFPFLIFLLALASFTSLTPDQVLMEIAKIIPNSSNEMILGVLKETQDVRSQTLLSVGVLGAIWSASKGVDAIMRALNKAYDEEENRPFWQVKGLSILFTLVIAGSILLTFFMLVFGKWIGQRIFLLFRVPGYFDEVWQVAQYGLPLMIMAVVFSFLYKYIPNCPLKFKEVMPGAIFATLGWILTSILFSFYVNNFGNYSKSYGSIGGIIVLLIWLYLSSIIILLGGEINAILNFYQQKRIKANTRYFSREISFMTKNKK